MATNDDTNLQGFKNIEGLGMVAVQEFQTLWDIAIQTCGCVDAIFAYCYDNNLAITDIPIPGTLIKNVQTRLIASVSETRLIAPQPINEPVLKYYRLYKLRPATGNTNDTCIVDPDIDPPVEPPVDPPVVPPLILEGIDYWALEVDFVVQ